MGDFIKWLLRKLNQGPQLRSQDPQSPGSRSDSEDNKRPPFRGWLILVLLIGIGLMIMNSMISVEREVVTIPETQPVKDQQAFGGRNSDVPSTMEDYEEIYEAELREILQEMVGVGSVSVMVVIDSTEEVVVKENTNIRESRTEEKDQQGGSRVIKDVSRQGEVVLYSAKDGEKPIILKKVKPNIRGVLIVAKGADKAVIQKMIKDAVSKSLSVPYHKISVQPKKY